MPTGTGAGAEPVLVGGLVVVARTGRHILLQVLTVLGAVSNGALMASRTATPTPTSVPAIIPATSPSASTPASGGDDTSDARGERGQPGGRDDYDDRVVDRSAC